MPDQPLPSLPPFPSEASPEALSYSIEQVATRTSMTKRTLRYYEEVGLLRPTERTEGNYRRYTERDVLLLERIKELRDLLGFSLTDIRTLLQAEEERVQIQAAFRQETQPVAKIAQLERADLLIHQQLTLVEQKIEALQAMRSSLLARLDRHTQTNATLLQTLSTDTPSV